MSLEWFYLVVVVVVGGWLVDAIQWNVYIVGGERQDSETH